MNEPQEILYTAILESKLRGLHETPLRALKINGMYITDENYIVINTCDKYPLMWLIEEVTIRNVVSNLNYPQPIGTIFEEILPAPGSYAYDDGSFQRPFPDLLGQLSTKGAYSGDLLDWTPHTSKPVSWTVGFVDLTNQLSHRPYGPGNEPDYEPGIFVWNGFAVYPCPTADIVTHNPSGVIVTGNSRKGASMIFCKLGIKGVVSVHTVIDHPTTDLYGVVSPVVSTLPVDVTEDFDPWGYVDPESPNNFRCEGNQMMIFWIGKTAADLTALLPNSGPPHFTPINFSPGGYGLLSSYTPVNPPYP